MQIAKAFFLMVKRQNTTLIIYLSVFAVLIIFFAKSGKEQQETIYESSSLNIVIQDRDQSELSKSLYQYLTDKHHVKKDTYTEEELADELYYENVDYVLMIPKGFGENMVSGDTKDILENRKRPGSISGYFIDEQIQQYLSMISTYLAAGYTPKEAASYTWKASAKEAEVNFLSSEHQDGNDIMYYAFCYMPYILICLLTVGLGAILITFRQKDINTRLLCSSQSSLQRNLQLTLGGIIFSLICWGSLLLLSTIVLRINCFSVQWLLYLLNSFVFLLFALSLTFFFSFLIHSDAVLNMVANIVGLGLSFLGGIYVPLDMMSSTVVTFSRLLPSYWYIIALGHIGDYDGKRSQMTQILSCMGIELLFAVAVFCAALAASHLKKQE